MGDNKIFTQEEMNTIIQDRLAKEKLKYENKIADMQADISRRERRLEAKERLNVSGLPAELVDLVNLTDEDSLNTSLTLIEKTYKQQNTSPDKKESYNPQNGSSCQEDPIRTAMGLKR